MRQLVACDSETYPIGPGELAPKIVSWQTAVMGEDVQAFLTSNADDDFLPTIEHVFTREELRLTFCNAAFDLAVVCANFPHLIPAVFRAVAGPPEHAFEWPKLPEICGRVYDVKIREKLLNLSEHGSLTFKAFGKGGVMKTFYDLASLEKDYIGRDRSDQKGDDSWRANMAQLDGVPSDQWPKEPYLYGLEDAEGTIRVHLAQEERLKKNGGSLATEKFQVAVDFALRLIACTGWPIDNVAKAEIASMLERELAPEKHKLCLELGLIRAAVEPRVKNKKGELTKGKKETRDLKAIGALIHDVCVEHGLEIVLTDKGDEIADGGGVEALKQRRPADWQRYICQDAEVMENVAPFNEALKELKGVLDLQKLVTTEIPRMGDLGMMWCGYNVIVETGRTSSAGEKKKKDKPPLYPSGNIQNVDPRARGCYVAPEGWVLYSVDYSSLEFCTFAQVCYSLFGFSAMRELLLEGHDPHAFLGAQMSFAVDKEFHSECRALQIQDDRHAIYQFFAGMKKNDAHRTTHLACAINHSDRKCDHCGCRQGDEPPAWSKFFSLWRTMAKPVGFGFPGGLAEKTLCSMAKASYGVTITHDQAKLFKELFYEVYPEGKLHKEWVSKTLQDGEDTYAYVTPFGMVRRGAKYCAAMNGTILQSPAAEGAKLATFEVVRACYDPTYNNGEPSILYNSRVLAFIHDEICGRVPEDDFMPERVAEVERLMVASMKVVMPDVPIKAKGCLMRRWSKDAEPVFDRQGRLTIWTPKEN